MTIFLVRHSRALVPEGVCGGWSDWPLADDFEAAAQKIVAALPKVISRVESSPLVRCRLLAERLGAHFEAPLQLDERLREVHFGAWENRAWDDLNADELNSWMNDWVNVAPPGGENFLELQARVVAWWRELEAGDQPIVAVMHAGPIRALLCHLLGMPPKNAFRIEVELGSVCKLKRDSSNLNAATLQWLNF